ncbi:MAG: DUF1127 domain-containing protein [Pseudorhodobacter sp.]|nr:DUF1127 domain-containing protein [Pseudorhodobacter sp.]
MAYMNASRPAFAGLSDRFTSAWKLVREALHRRAVFNTTMRELSTLSDRELSDLGIARTMIRQIALEAAYGK